MKYYCGLTEFLKDYRDKHGLSQAELAAKLDVDIKTVSRWESGKSFIRPEKVAEVAEKLFVPYQFLHNINSCNAVKMFYDIDMRIYSFSAAGTKVPDISLFKIDMPDDDVIIRKIEGEEDLQFVIKSDNYRIPDRKLKKDLIKGAANILPEINLIIIDSTNTYAGYTVFLPLRKEVYDWLKNKEISQDDLSEHDFVVNTGHGDFVYYFYTLYADSFKSTYYLMKRVLNYFSKLKSKDYLITGITFTEVLTDILKDMEFHDVWKEKLDGVHENESRKILMEGDFKKYMAGAKKE
jgi:transcriptional regulator with XRE-family HTH domain